jgi:hypothetical protein
MKAINSNIQNPERSLCAECGSEDISFDAVAQWDKDRQEFSVCTTMDKGHVCENCGATDSVIWEPIK